MSKIKNYIAFIIFILSFNLCLFAVYLNPQISEDRDSLIYYISQSEDLVSSDPQKGVNIGKKASMLASLVGNDEKVIDALIAVSKNFNELPGMQDSAYYYLKLANKLSVKLEKPESIIRTNYVLAEYLYNNYKYDEAKRIFSESLKLKLPDSLIYVADSYYLLGSTERDLGNYDDALTYVKLALDQYIKLGDDKRTVRAYLKIGHIYKLKGNNELALNYYRKGLTLASNTQDTARRIKALEKIGVLYKNLMEYDKALEFLSEAKELAEQNGTFAEYGNILRGLGSVHNRKRDFEEALKWYWAAYKISEETNDLRLKLICLNSIGNIHKRKKDYDLALANFEEALQIADENNFYHDKMVSNSNIGISHAYLGNYGKAISILNESVIMAKEVDSYSALSDCYEYLTVTYRLMNDYKNAFRYADLHMRVKDSLFSQSISSKLAEMKAEYQNEVKEREIEILKSKNKLSEVELESSKNMTNMLIVLSIVLIFSGGLLLFLYRNKKNSNKELENKNIEINSLNSQLKLQNQRLVTSENHLKSANNAKDKFFSIIAHDLKNPIQAVKGYTEMLREDFEEFSEREKLEIIDSIYEATEEQLKLLQNLLTWARSQTGRIEFQPQRVNLLELTTEAIKPIQQIAYQKQIRINSYINPEIFVNADMEMMSTIYRNLVSNAVKFTFPGGTINITSRDSSGFVENVIEDSGVGMDSKTLQKLFQVDSHISTKGTSNESGTGLGLLICKEFVETNGGRIWVESEENKGSRFYFSVPMADYHN